MAETFWETGASGRRYSREYCLGILEQRMREPVVGVWETSEFHCMEIAPDNYLLTYTLLQGERLIIGTLCREIRIVGTPQDRIRRGADA